MLTKSQRWQTVHDQFKRATKFNSPSTNIQALNRQQMPLPGAIRPGIVGARAGPSDPRPASS